MPRSCAACPSFFFYLHGGVPFFCRLPLLCLLPTRHALHICRALRAESLARFASPGLILAAALRSNRLLPCRCLPSSFSMYYPSNCAIAPCLPLLFGFRLPRLTLPGARQLDGALEQEMLLSYELKRNNSLMASELGSCRAQQRQGESDSAAEACQCSNETGVAGVADVSVELERVKKERDIMRRERDEALVKLLEYQIKRAPSAVRGAGGAEGGEDEVDAAFAAAAQDEAACCSKTCNAEC